MKTPTKSAALLGATALIVGGATAVHAEPNGYEQDQLHVGYLYGTLGQAPNVVMTVGGTAEEFCLDNPDDPFNAEPGSAPLRMFSRTSGATDWKVNDKDQPIHLYEADGEAPDFIIEACVALFDDDPATTVPTAFASGTADLKVRISYISDELIDVFNSVNGTAVSPDGTNYKVRASADLVIEDGIPLGDPSEFLSFTLSEIRHGA